MPAVSLGDIVSRLGGRLIGDPSIQVDRVATLENAREGSVAFLANPKYGVALQGTAASAVVLAGEQVAHCPVAAIETSQPYLYFARLSALLNPVARPDPGVAASALCESEVPTSCYIGPGAYIAPSVRLGERTIIGAGCRLHENSSVGDDAHLVSGVTLYPGCMVGHRAVIHAGAVIGADGFGFAKDEAGAWVKIPQVGRVIIGDDVEIGANTTIDRGAIEDTVIGDGVKLDNQIQIAHNVTIGDHTAIAGCVGIAGSARIGRHCTIGGGAVILGHLSLADRTHVSSGTLVSKSIPKPGTYTGTVPFMPHEDWLRNFSRLRHLEAMADKIRGLENRIAELEKKQ